MGRRAIRGGQSQHLLEITLAGRWNWHKKCLLFSLSVMQKLYESFWQFCKKEKIICKCDVKHQRKQSTGFKMQSFVQIYTCKESLSTFYDFTEREWEVIYTCLIRNPFYLLWPGRAVTMDTWWVVSVKTCTENNLNIQLSNFLFSSTFRRWNVHTTSTLYILENGR